MLKDADKKFNTAMELLSDAVTNAQLRCLFYEDAMNMSNEEASEAFEAWQAEHGMDVLLARCAARDEEDESKGGNFQMFSSKKRRLRFNQEISGETRGFDERELILEKEIEYKKNTALFFPASKDSIHAVSKREETVFFRKAIGIDITCESYRSYDENSM